MERIYIRYLTCPEEGKGRRGEKGERHEVCTDIFKFILEDPYVSENY
jgi:hypothetical protein